MIQMAKLLLEMEIQMKKNENSPTSFTPIPSLSHILIKKDW